AGILGEILLVVVLGEVEGARRQDLGRDGPVAGGLQPLGVGVPGPFGRCRLRCGKGVYPGPVLRAHVVALAVALRRVVVLPEDLQQVLVADDTRVVDYADDLVVAGLTGAGLLVGGVGREAGGIARHRQPDARDLPELAFHAPEAAHAEHRLFHALGQ